MEWQAPHADRDEGFAAMATSFAGVAAGLLIRVLQAADSKLLTGIVAVEDWSVRVGGGQSFECEDGLEASKMTSETGLNAVACLQAGVWSHACQGARDGQGLSR